ncbi:MAG: ABC transporter permease [Clostridia bacterium]|nr:ABC transporter permease [Clostridia bacterium]
MRNTLILAGNTLKILFRHKIVIAFCLVLPIVTTLISLSIYSSTGSKPINIGIVNKDTGTIATDLVKSISSEEKFEVISLKDHQVNENILKGKVDCVLRIPANFTQNIHNNTLNKVQLVSIKGEEATSWVENYVEIFVRNIKDIASAAKGDRDSFDKMYKALKEDSFILKVTQLEDQYKSKRTTSQSLGFLIMFMMIGTGVVSDCILMEKRTRTYYRICSAPVKAKNYIFGNAISNFAIVFTQISMVLIIAIGVLRMKPYIPLGQLLLIMGVFGITAVAISMMITSFAESTTQTNIIQNLVVLPSCLLGGCMWPIDVMPDFMQKLANFIPQKWALDAISKLQAGSSFYSVLINLSILLAFSLAFFLIAVYRYSRNANYKTFV